MSQTAVQQYQPNQFDSRQIDIMRRTVAAGTTPEDFALFLEVCKHRGLNPFAREIYAIVRSNKMTIQVSIDGFRKLAERSGKYRGQLGPYWCDESGEWKEEWLQKKPPVAAKVGILRADFDKPIWAVARYDAYVQPSSPLWQKMPDVLLAKCAEALGLRKTFPDEMSGLYVHEEMAQAGKSDKPLPVVSTEPEVIEADIVPDTSVDASNGRKDEPTGGPAPTDHDPYSWSTVLQRAKDSQLFTAKGAWSAFLKECFPDVPDKEIAESPAKRAILVGEIRRKMQMASSGK